MTDWQDGVPDPEQIEAYAAQARELRRADPEQYRRNLLLLLEEHAPGNERLRAAALRMLSEDAE